MFLIIKFWFRREENPDSGDRFEPLMMNTSLYKTDCVCTAARRAARSVTQLYDLVLAPVGLKATQFVVLQAIGEHGEIAQHELAREYALSLENLSRRLSKMRAAGWIQVRLANNRKAHIYSLTEKGREMLQYANPYWLRAQKRLADVLERNSETQAVIRELDALAVAATNALSLRTTNTSVENSFKHFQAASDSDSR